MNATVEDLSPTIVPKSDQLNADQLLGGPITITVSGVKIGSTDEQPISVHYPNDEGRPFKPCKTMRKVLVLAWGADGRKWAGRSMTLYTDPSVRFGKDEVGGIRISHLSDIERDISVNLNATKGKKKLYEIKRLQAPAAKIQKPARTAAHDAMVAEFEKAARESGFTAFKGMWEGTAKEDRAAIGIAERDRIGALAQSIEKMKADIANATSAETAALVLDQARDVLGAEDMAELEKAYQIGWE